MARPAVRRFARAVFAPLTRVVFTPMTRAIFTPLNGVIAAVAVIVAIAVAWIALDRAIVKAPGRNEDPVLVTINFGDGHETIGARLLGAGIISRTYYYDAARILAGRAYVPKAGEYLLPARASLVQALGIIHAGRGHQRKIAIIEGMTSRQVIAEVRANDYLTGEVGVELPEGDVLPETYFFTRGTSRDDILLRMQEKLAISLAEAWALRAAGLPIETPRDALILASVVELEAAGEAERREVAGIFMNRLRRRMRLQSDPTVLYGTEGDAGRPIRQSDLDRETAWNTYVIRGLPATPICNPGLDAIDAVLQPASTDNLYFVADGKGGLRFSRTIDEHNVNVRLYRKTLRERDAASARARSGTAPATGDAAARDAVARGGVGK